MANFSQVNAVSGGQVKTATDMWLVRSGALVPAQSAWAVKGGQLVKVWERAGGPVNMTILSPDAGTSVQHGFALLWRVQVPKIDGARIGGTVTFTQAGIHVGSSVTNATVDETTGIAEAWLNHWNDDMSVTISFSSDNGYSAPSLQRSVFAYGGDSSLVFTSPSYDQVFYGPTNVTYTVRALPVAGQIPQGVVRIAASDSLTQYQDVTLDANGYASATFYCGSGNRYASVTQRTTTNGFTLSSAFHRIRMLINTRYQQTEYYSYAGHRNYAGAGGGPQQNASIVSGDLSGTSWRAFTLVNRPAKPQSDANCVAASAVYTSGLNNAGIRIGYHTINGYPSTGSFSQGGVNQNLVTGSGAPGEHWVDIGLHVAAAINNDTLRGLVFGGPSGSTPYSLVNSANYCGLVVVWEWWRWIDT